MTNSSKHPSTKNNPLYGLVLAGGKSRRMKKDKSLIIYHQKSQLDHTIELLSSYCKKVFISIREEQRKQNHFNKHPQIIDQYHKLGPLGGMLSAINDYPNKAWFVVACDLPFINHQTLSFLCANRNVNEKITVYKSTTDGLPEPLCGIYEAGAESILKKNFENNITCPRKICINQNLALLQQPLKNALTNVNTEDDYNNALKQLNPKTFNKNNKNN